MATDEPEPTGATAPANPPPVAAAGSGRRVVPVALAAGALAAALTWAAGEASVERFTPKATGNLAAGPLEGFVSTDAAHRAEVKNAALAYGLQGAILGLVLGLAGGAVRRSAGSAAAGGIAGLVLGGALGTGASLGAFPLVLAHRIGMDPSNMLPSLLGHAAVCASVGGAAGAAFGLGFGGGSGFIRGLIGGLVGAAVGAGVYEVLGAVAFPADLTGDPIAASRSARLLAHALVDPSVAAGAALAVRSTAKPTAAP